MGAATRGHLTLSGAPLDEMGAVLSLYQKIGGQYTRKSGTLVADSKNVQHAVPYVETEEYPGFPTDLQSLYLAAAMTLEGKSCICENVFEDRLRTAEELQKMGGTLQICGKWLTAEKSRLHGAEVVSQDLRGGAALVSAALAAEGFSTIRQTELIERGYERFPETLRELGAKNYRRKRNMRQEKKQKKEEKQKNTDSDRGGAWRRPCRCLDFLMCSKSAISRWRGTPGIQKMKSKRWSRTTSG